MLKKIILDTLFPINCIFCQKNNCWICPECFKKIHLLSSQVCPYCEKVFSEKGRACSKCKKIFRNKNKKILLDKLVVSTKYSETNLDRLVHLYKYNFIEDLRIPLGKILLSGFLKNNLSLPDFIIPVPLHKRRLRWRGFNQAELLGNYLGENLSPALPIPVLTNALLRKKYTPAQMKIKSYAERQKNIRQAFKINSQINLGILKGKNILLVDDICTTGATLIECAKILKENDVKQVNAIVLARQEIK